MIRGSRPGPVALGDEVALTGGDASRREHQRADRVLGRTDSFGEERGVYFHAVTGSDQEEGESHDSVQFCFWELNDRSQIKTSLLRGHGGGRPAEFNVSQGVRHGGGWAVGNAGVVGHRPNDGGGKGQFVERETQGGDCARMLIYENFGNGM